MVHHECVAFLTRSISDECHFSRFLALLATAGTRTVWLLYNHEPEFATVQRLQLRYPRLRLAQQPSVVQPAWKTFGGKLVGYSKAAFLMWAQNASSCAHVWQVEDDVFATGQWSKIFDAHSQSHADLIANVGPLSNQTRSLLHNVSAEEIRNRATPEATRARNCWLQTMGTDRLPCWSARGPELHITIWPFLRLSQRLVLELRAILDERGGHGFHEYLLAPACAHARWNCTIEPPREDVIGEVASGHTPGVPKARSTLERFGEQRPANETAFKGGKRTLAGRVFHPVKCEADAELGQKALRWAGVEY